MIAFLKAHLISVGRAELATSTAIKDETIIIVKYEDDLSTFLSGPIEGSRYFLVPSMEVFQAPAAAHIIDRAGRDDRGRLRNLTFPSPFPLSKWFWNPEEDQPIEESHTLPQRFPPFDGKLLDMVLFHEITLMDIPRSRRALASRIRWLLPATSSLLTLQCFGPLVDPSNSSSLPNSIWRTTNLFVPSMKKLRRQLQLACSLTASSPNSGYANSH
ncbi:hypothetical protein L5515_005027 [Caenorhabditis briggsae]|uniref:Uncharacterized protein n=1 Tax=Caenorhabditis briggsae TaxID=6238 RepID=A0AAE9ENJ1_CAEBR|nr:hypothetical protein L5515_005027 [Caenorhabditis briggsae]